MDYSDKIAKRMPISLVDADESAKIAGIGDAMLQMGSTPAEVRSRFLLDEDFIPDALQAFRFRCDKYFAKTEKWFEAR